MIWVLLVVVCLYWVYKGPFRNPEYLGSLARHIRTPSLVANGPKCLYRELRSIILDERNWLVIYRLVNQWWVWHKLPQGLLHTSGQPPPLEMHPFFYVYLKKSQNFRTEEWLVGRQDSDNRQGHRMCLVSDFSVQGKQRHLGMQRLLTLVPIDKVEVVLHHLLLVQWNPRSLEPRRRHNLLVPGHLWPLKCLS